MKNFFVSLRLLPSSPTKYLAIKEAEVSIVPITKSIAKLSPPFRYLG